MKKFFRNIIQFMLVSYLVLTLSKGIQMPESILYITASLVILSLGMLLVSPFLKFLTVKENFITTMIMSTLILIGMFFLLDTFMIDFHIQNYTFEAINMGSLTINSFEVIPLITIGSASLAISFLGSLLFVLEKST